MNVVDVPTCYVDNRDKLTGLVKILQEKDLLAVDTEFVKMDTLYPLPALVQLYDGESFYLVDVVTLDKEERDIFWRAFVSSSATFVFFSMHEDLELIHYCAGKIPARVDDLQVMLSFLGLTQKAGLADTVKRFIGAELLKDQTLSTWLQRPLNEDQIRYAAMDVYYLLDLYRIMMSDMDKKGNYEIYRQEIDYVTRKIFTPYDPDTEYLRYARGKMSLQELARLRALVAYRYDTAHKFNVPIQQVIRKDILPNLCQIRIREPTGLVKAGMHWRAVKQYGSDVIRILNNNNIDTTGISTEPVTVPQEYASVYIEFVDAIKGFCREHGISEVEILSRKQQTDLFLWLLRKDRKSFYTPTIIYSAWRMKLLYNVMKNNESMFSDEDFRIVAGYAGIDNCTEESVNG